MCNTMEELAGKETATKLGGTGSHLVDPARRRIIARSLEQARLRHLWSSLRCGSVDNRRTETQKHTEREMKRRPQQEYQGALELARVQAGLGGDVHRDWPDQCAAWNLDFLPAGMRDLGLKTATTSACALGVKHTPTRKTRRTTMAHCVYFRATVTLLCQGEHQQPCSRKQLRHVPDPFS